MDRVVLAWLVGIVALVGGLVLINFESDRADAECSAARGYSAACDPPERDALRPY